MRTISFAASDDPSRSGDFERNFFEPDPTTAMSQVTIVFPFTLAAKPEHGYLRRIVGRLRAVAEKLFSRQRQREQLIASHYAGCSWGDATERRINDEIGKLNWTSL